MKYAFWLIFNMTIFACVKYSQASFFLSFLSYIYSAFMLSFNCYLTKRIKSGVKFSSEFYEESIMQMVAYIGLVSVCILFNYPVLGSIFILGSILRLYTIVTAKMKGLINV
jgi:hypothetical protein